jgi:predicted tellurium resistance membrane protein TerC
MIEIFFRPESWIALTTLTAMEIVLGIDNIVFLTILVSNLPERQQPSARSIGLLLALGTRLLLLFAISWIMSLTAPLFSVLNHAFSGRDLILISGGLFLVAKATVEIHERVEAPSPARKKRPARPAGVYGLVLLQIALLDIVFSLDSVITAVGMAQHLQIMVAAMVIAVGVMLFSAGPISSWVTRHPSLKILALSFLILIGVTLIADGLGRHIEKGYVYFAMAFSLAVEIMNLRAHTRQQPSGASS